MENEKGREFHKMCIRFPSRVLSWLKACRSIYKLRKKDNMDVDDL